MAQTSLTVEKREQMGKGHTGRLRRSGRIPGILYGDGKEPVALVRLRLARALLGAAEANAVAPCPHRTASGSRSRASR